MASSFHLASDRGIWRFHWICFHGKKTIAIQASLYLLGWCVCPLADAICPVRASLLILSLQHLSRDERITHLALYRHCSGLPTFAGLSPGGEEFSKTWMHLTLKLREHFPPK